MATSVGARIRELPETKAVAAAPARAAAGARLLFVDNLRTFLTVLVVLHHLAITYGASGDWYFVEKNSTELTQIVLSLFTGLNHFYFMGLFFLISGYFVPAAVDRKGSWRYFKDRLVRLGIPLAVFMLLVNPIPLYFNGLNEGWWSGSFGRFVVGYWLDGHIAPGPLWFVEALLIFSLVYAAGHAILGRIKSRQAESASSASQSPLIHRRILMSILALAPFIFAARLFYPVDTTWIHFQLGMFPQYIFLFAAGILIYRRNWLPDLVGRLRKAWSTVAIVSLLSFPVLTILAGALEGSEAFKGGMSWQALLVAIWESFYCVSMAILLLGIFRQRFDRQDSLGRLLSRNAYTVYLIHAPVIVIVAYLLRGVSIYPLLKYVLVAPLAVGLCFLTSQLLVRRIPLADRVL